MKNVHFYAILTLFLLSSCFDSSNEPLPNLVLSKLITATSSKNNVIELYNASEKVINLNDFKLSFFTNGSKVVSSEIVLTGSINADSYYVIGSSNHDANYSNLFDYVHNAGSLPFNGNDAIELVYKNRVIDAIGVKGFDIEFSSKKTLIRLGEKNSYTPSPVYDAFNFISYLPDLFKYIKNDQHEIKTFEQLYEGPRLEERYSTYPFIQQGSTTIGGGGYVQTTNGFIADGDTASFSAAGAFGGGSVRYYYLNTPEVDGSYVVAEPWGYVASKYNKEFIMKNPSQSVFYVQSLMGSALKEVNNRSLGLIWVNGQLAQFLIVREGLSEDVGNAFSTIDLNHSYKEIPYIFYLQFAENQAKIKGWGTKGFPSNPLGEKSPDWNYSAGGGVGALATTNPIWQPKFPLPWN